MNDILRTYRILILPPGRIAATGLSLNEAAAWIATYNSIMEDQPLRAVVDEEATRRVEAPGAVFSLKTSASRRLYVRQQSGTKRAA